MTLDQTISELDDILMLSAVPMGRWGKIYRKPENPGGFAKLEAVVNMEQDRSRFTVHYPSGSLEELSATQFCALIVALKATRQFRFDRYARPPRKRVVGEELLRSAGIVPRQAPFPGR
ncbi:MAG: hypothetical protein WCH83_15035 [Alphaproteobacteria bacterium]